MRLKEKHRLERPIICLSSEPPSPPTPRAGYSHISALMEQIRLSAGVAMGLSTLRRRSASDGNLTFGRGDGTRCALIFPSPWRFSPNRRGLFVFLSHKAKVVLGLN